MTIIAGFSSSRQGSAPLNLAAQLARTTGEKIIAAAVVERALPAGVDPIEDEYRGYLASQASASLERVVDQVRGDLDISVTVHHSTSIPSGLMELVAQHSADVVVVGSSSSGLLGRIALGSVTERLVHTSEVPVAIAPRGYPSSPVPLQRLTAAYGGAADAVGLIATSAELAKQWKVAAADRVVHGAAVDDVRRLDRAFRRGARRSAVDEQDHGRGGQAAQRGPRQGSDPRRGRGDRDRHRMAGSRRDIAWETGDVLLLGSGAAGPMAQVFLGYGCLEDPAPRTRPGHDRAETARSAERSAVKPQVSTGRRVGDGPCWDGH